MNTWQKHLKRNGKESDFGHYQNYNQLTIKAPVFAMAGFAGIMVI